MPTPISRLLQKTLLIVVILAGAVRTAVAETQLFGVTAPVTGNGELVLLDPLTGAGTAIGETTDGGTNRKLQCAAADSAGRLLTIFLAQLFQIDTTNGNMTLLQALSGQPADYFLRGIAIDQSDNIFVLLIPGAGAPAGDLLYRVDSQTGNFVSVGPLGVTDARDIAFSPSGALYGISLSQGLMAVNPTSGAATAIGGDALGLEALTFDPVTSDCYGARFPLVRITPATGDGDNLGPTGFDVRGLAVIHLGDCEAVPAPCVSATAGDTDGDGDVGLDDWDVLVGCLTGPEQGAIPAQCQCADLNGDADIDLQDVASFQAHFTGEIKGPPSMPPAAPSDGDNALHCRPALGLMMDVWVYPLRSVDAYSGEVYETATDLAIKGRGLDFQWTRTYRSRVGPDTAMGKGWDHSYNIYIEPVHEHIRLHHGNARQDIFRLQPDGTWARDEFFQVLSKNPDCTYTLVFADTSEWHFYALDGAPAAGRISSSSDRNGNTQTFSYDGTGRLITINDTLNRTITLEYNPQDRIASLSDFTGRELLYGYSASGDLTSVRSPIVTGTPNANDFPVGKTTTYTYSQGFPDERLNHNLLTITDPKGQTFLVNTYAATANPQDPDFDRVISQQWGEPGDDLSVAYTHQTPPGESNSSAVLKVAVTDRNENVKHYFYDAGNRLVVERELTRGLRPGEPAFWEKKWDYNADSLATVVMHPNGNSITNEYETDPDFGGPGAPRRSRANLRRVTRLPGSLGGDQPSITESYTYALGLGGCGCGTSFVKTHTDGLGNITSNGYDEFGNRTHTVHPAGGGEENWSYNGAGQVLTHTLPANGSGHRRVDTYSYHAAGPQTGYLQSKVIDSTGFTLTTLYEVNAVGNVTRKIHPNGADTLYTYNELDEVVRELSREVTPGGVRYETLTWYDANGNVVRSDIENRDDSGALLGNTHFSTIYEYEILNRLTATCREKTSASLSNTQLTCAAFAPGEAVTTEHEYDANRNRTLTRFGEAVSGNQPTNSVGLTYDERDLRFQITRAPGDPDESTNQYDYDANGNLTRRAQGINDLSLLLITEQGYDGFNRLISTTDAMGNVTARHYNANGDLTSQRIDGELVDVNGGAGNVRLSEVTFEYDSMGRRTRQDVAHFNTQTQANIGDGFSTRQWVFANNGQVTSSTDDNGNVTSTTYDTANRPLTVTDAKGNTATYSYDGNSNVATVVESELSDLGGPIAIFTTTYAYDDLDRRTLAMDNIGNTEQYAYNSRGDRVLRTDAGGNATRFHYDGLSRPRRTVRDLDDDGPDDAQPGDGNADIVTTQDWDDSSRLNGRRDDNSNATSDDFDARNQPVSTNYADGCSADTRMYDVHGNVVSSMDANGTLTVSTYDLLQRLTGKSITPGPGVSSDTTSETYSYDGIGNLLTAANDLSTVERTYDSLGNVLTDTQTATGLGVPRTITCTFDGMSNKLTAVYLTRTATMTYDSLNRLKTVTDSLIGGTIATYDYIGRSRVQRRTNNVTGVMLDYEYDGARRITRTWHNTAGLTLDDREYAWDANYNKTRRENIRAAAAGYRHLYAYDPAYRLTQTTIVNRATGQNDRVTQYQLDGVGSRTLVTGSHVLDPGSYTMTPVCEPADFEMNQYTTTPSGTRAYDKNGNTLTANGGTADQVIAGCDYANRMVSATVAGSTTTYRYDVLGRRIVKCEGGICSGASLNRYIYDGWLEVNNTTGVGGSPASWVFGLFIDEPLTMNRGGSNYYYHGDDLGNIMALSDTSGTIVERYEYDDFGRPLGVAGSPNPLQPIANPSPTADNPLLFNGRRFDTESDWYYYRTRYLDPRPGRFTSQDMIGIWGDSGNLGSGSIYVGNNPASRLDPSGLRTRGRYLDDWFPQWEPGQDWPWGFHSGWGPVSPYDPTDPDDDPALPDEPTEPQPPPGATGPRIDTPDHPIIETDYCDRLPWLPACDEPPVIDHLPDEEMLHAPDLLHYDYEDLFGYVNSSARYITAVTPPGVAALAAVPRFLRSVRTEICPRLCDTDGDEMYGSQNCTCLKFLHYEDGQFSWILTRPHDCEPCQDR